MDDSLPPSEGLAPPPEGSHPSIDSLMMVVNDYASAQGYAVSKKRSKRRKIGAVFKIWLGCDMSSKVKSKSLGYRRSASRATECSFECIAQLDDNDDWQLTVKNASHNHESSLFSAHPIHRRNAMTREVLAEIAKRVKQGSKTATILGGLRMNHDEENPIFKTRDVYNARAYLRQKELGPLTPTQALMRALSDDEE